jgi:hypothetical protein
MIDHQPIFGLRRSGKCGGNDGRAEKRRQEADNSRNSDASWHRGSSGVLGHLSILVADQASDADRLVWRRALAISFCEIVLKMINRIGSSGCTILLIQISKS